MKGFSDTLNTSVLLRKLRIATYSYVQLLIACLFAACLAPVIVVVRCFRKSTSTTLAVILGSIGAKVPCTVMKPLQPSFYVRDKGEVQGITFHKGPEGEQRHSSTLSLISVLEDGGWSRPRSHHFNPLKDTRYPLYRSLDGRQGRSGIVWLSHPQRDSIP